MSLVEAVVLGVVQGVTEFLPISSTAHLRVVPALLGWADPGVAYSAVIQLGSVLAVLAYFWKDLLAILKGACLGVMAKDFAKQEVRILGGILLGTLPICVIGLALKDVLEQPNGPFRSLSLIGAASIFMGALLLMAEKAGQRVRTLDDVGARDGLIVGLGQALALIPGCSRSGSTLTVALLMNMRREDGARFSFLLGIPAIVLSGLLELKELLTHGLGDAGINHVAVGLVTSTLVSYLCIAWLLRFLQKHSTYLFIAYRFLFGAVVLGLSAAHLIR